MWYLNYPSYDFWTTCSPEGISRNTYNAGGAYVVTYASYSLDGIYKFSVDYEIERDLEFETYESFGIYYSDKFQSTADPTLTDICYKVKCYDAGAGTLSGTVEIPKGNYYLYIKIGADSDPGCDNGNWIKFTNFRYEKVEVSQETTIDSVTLSSTNMTTDGEGNNILTLIQGKTEQLTATVSRTPVDAEVVVTWNSSDPDIATVNDGEVSAKSVGTTIITATCGDKSAECSVTVTPYVFEVTAETPYTGIKYWNSENSTLWTDDNGYKVVNTNTHEKESGVATTRLNSHKFILAPGTYIVTFRYDNSNYYFNNGTQIFRFLGGDALNNLSEIKSVSVADDLINQLFRVKITIPAGDPQDWYCAIDVDRASNDKITGRELAFSAFRIDKDAPVSSAFVYNIADENIYAGRVYDNKNYVGLGKIYVTLGGLDGTFFVNPDNALPITLANSSGTVQSWGKSSVSIDTDYNGVPYIELTVDGKNIRNDGEYTLTIPEAFFLNGTQDVTVSSKSYTVRELPDSYRFALAVVTPSDKINLKELPSVLVNGSLAGSSIVECITPVTFNGKSYSTINIDCQLAINANITEEGVYELSIPEGTLYVSDANGNCYPNSALATTFEVGIYMPEKVAELEPVLTSWQFNEGWGTTAEQTTTPVWNYRDDDVMLTATGTSPKTLSQINLVRLENGKTYSVHFTVDASTDKNQKAEFIIHNSLDLGEGVLAKVEQNNLASGKNEFCKSFTVSETGWYYLILRLTPGASGRTVKVSNFALYPSTNETPTALTTTVAKTDEQYYNVTIDDVVDSGSYTKDLNAAGALPEGWQFNSDDAGAQYAFVDRGGVKFNGPSSDSWILTPGFKLASNNDLNYIVTVKVPVSNKKPNCEKGAFELWMSNTGKGVENNTIKLIDESEGVIDNDGYFSTLVKINAANVSADDYYYFGIRPKSGAANATFEITGFELKCASGYVTYSSNAGTVTISGENDKFKNQDAVDAFKDACTAYVTLYDATSLVFPMNLEFGTNVNPNAIVDTKDTEGVITLSGEVNKVVKYTEGYNTLYRAEKLAMVDDYIPETTNSYPFNFGHNAITCSDVQLTRKQSLNNLMAVTLPFGLELTKLPDGVKVYKMKGSNDDYISFYEAKEDIPAYTSVLIKDERATPESLTLGGSDFVKSNSSKIGEVNIVDLGTTSGETWYCGYTTSTVGINAGSGEWASYDVYYFSANDGNFKKANNNGTLTIRPFRAIFLKRHTTPQQAPASFGVRLDNDAPTGIEAPQVVEEEASPAYTLDGIRVSENYRGIVVRKGQKTFEAQ